MVLVANQVQFHLVVVVALGLLDAFFFPVAIVADVVGGAGIVSSVHRSVQLRNRLGATRQTLFSPHDPLNQVLVLGQNGQLLRIVAEFDCESLRRYLYLAVTNLGQQVPLRALFVDEALERVFMRLLVSTAQGGLAGAIHLADVRGDGRGVDFAASHHGQVLRTALLLLKFLVVLTVGFA